jgi:hypothetical protein
MPRRALIATLLLTGSLGSLATLLAQTSFVDGNVTGADGRPLKDAEIRFE